MMLMKKNFIFFAAYWISAVLLSSCDEGRIHEKEVVVTPKGRVVKLTGTISGINSWASGYDVGLAGFEEGDSYPVVSKSLLTISEGAPVQLILSGIPENVTSLRLCAIDRLRRSIADFYTLDKEAIKATSDTLFMNVGGMNVAMYAAVQKVFNNRCIACHGVSTFAARGLYLTEGKSYAGLVNVPSVINPDSLRVKPGNAEESYLHLVLNKEGYDTHGHLDILSGEPDKLTLIDAWINNGALEKEKTLLSK